MAVGVRVGLGVFVAVLAADVATVGTLVGVALGVSAAETVALGVAVGSGVGVAVGGGMNSSSEAESIWTSPAAAEPVKSIWSVTPLVPSGALLAVVTVVNAVLKVRVSADAALPSNTRRTVAETLEGPFTEMDAE